MSYNNPHDRDRIHQQMNLSMGSLSMEWTQSIDVIHSQYILHEGGPPVLTGQEAWTEQYGGTSRTPLLTSGQYGGSPRSALPAPSSSPIPNFGGSYTPGGYNPQPYNTPSSPFSGPGYLSSPSRQPFNPQSSPFGASPPRQPSTPLPGPRSPTGFSTLDANNTFAGNHDYKNFQPQSPSFTPLSPPPGPGAMVPYQPGGSAPGQSQYPPGWRISDYMTREEMTRLISRFCEEINWDWYQDHHQQILANVDRSRMPERMLQETWEYAKELYEDYCSSRAHGEDTFNFIAKLHLGEAADVTYTLRSTVHNMFCFFGPFERGEESKAEEMAKDLLSGGDLIKYVKQRCEKSGLDYPGGTGRTQERMGLIGRAIERQRQGWW